MSQPMFEILQYEFMQRALIAGLIIAIIAPLLGTFLVVRRYSLLSDTLAHVALTGVAIGLLIGIHPIVGAVILTIVTAIAIEMIRQKRDIFGESLLAIFLSGSLAVAVVIMSSLKSLDINFINFLFGSITTVQPLDLWIIGILGVFVMLLTFFLYRTLFLVSFDEELAKAAGLPTHALNIVLMIFAAITVALSMQIIGALLIGAMMVIPVITASQFAKSFLQSIIYSCILAVLAVLTGLTLSFYFDLASGATIVVVLLFFFIISIFAEKH